MSPKSIKLFEQHTGGRYKAPLQDRLRHEAVALRAKAHAMLTQAARLDEMADELDPPKADELKL